MGLKMTTLQSVTDIIDFVYINVFIDRDLKVNLVFVFLAFLCIKLLE